MFEDFYVHGDVHNYVDDARAWLSVVKPRKVIWLGDFWDQYFDTPDDAKKTARFVKEDVIEARPQDIIILSNHDVTYRFPVRYATSRWGFTHEKCRAIHSVFPREYWDKFQVFHEEEYRGQKVLFSHAGLMMKFCVNGNYDYNFLKRMEKANLEVGDLAIEKAPLLDSLLGPLWVRWKLPILFDVCQVVGHTPYDTPQISKQKGYSTWNLNMDCAKNFVAHFTENGIYYVNKRTGERTKAKYLDSEIK